MRTFRIIIHSVLVVAMLVAGLPLYYQPGDANRDDRVDLADAILRVQGVARTAEEPAQFRDSLEGALITLSAVAGFTKAIKADRGAASQQNINHLTIFAFNAGYDPELMPVNMHSAEHRAFFYRSPALAPLTPPPLSV